MLRVPVVIVTVVLAREPLARWIVDYRFSRAEPALTKGAKAYLADPTAPVPKHLGSFTIVERQKAGNGVVFYAAGVGPLILERCGLAYFPTGSGRFDHIHAEWCLYCL